MTTIFTRYTFVNGVLTQTVTTTEYRSSGKEPVELPPADPSIAGSEELSTDSVAEPLTTAPPLALADPSGTASSPYTKRRRGLMGLIRSLWFYIFTALGALVDFAIAKLTEWSLPPGTATLIGGALYGAKRAFWPDTTI